jgi:bifunctional DNA-binding transcriptional regulator/antitoxin component of YhaV-PrlF toxin-antitoxin module
MNETVSVDSKGRLVLPKKTRLEAGIDVNHRLVVRATGIGRVELLDTNVLMTKAQEIGSKKLTGWDEANHEAASYVSRTMKKR